MKRTSTVGVTVGAVTVALLAALSGCGDDGGGGGDASPTPSATKETVTKSPSPTKSPTGADEGAATVSLRSADGLGPILTDESGQTLYLFEADKGTESSCSGACADAWPPLTTSGKATTEKDVKADLLGKTEREDGTTQVTYNGHPLYYYADDSKAGDTLGQDLDQFGAKWYVLDASGNAVKDSGGGQDGDEQEEDGTSGGYGR